MRLGTTIILTTHYLEEAEQLCRNIAIINNGRIVENTSMRQLLSRMDTHTLVLDLLHPIAQAPALQGFATRLVDEHTLEVGGVQPDQYHTVVYGFIRAEY